MTENCAVFSKNIKDLMHKKNCTQIDIAKYMNTSASSVSNWVNGAYMPNSKSIVLLAEFFGVTPSILLSEEHPMSFATSEEERMLRMFRMLSPKGKEKALERLDELNKLYWYD